MTTNESQDNVQTSIETVRKHFLSLLDNISALTATVQKEPAYTVKDAVALLKSYSIEYSAESVALNALWLEDECKVNNETIVSCAVSLMKSALKECEAISRNEEHNLSGVLLRDVGVILGCLSQLVVVKTE